MPDLKSNHPVISVIILSYNTKDLTLKCLDMLKKSILYLNKSVETIVVENGTDGTGNEIKKKFPWVKLIEPKENTGFARGQNIGIKSANKNSSFYLLLNSDAFVEKETLKKSLEFMSSNVDCHLLGCKLTYENGKLQPSAGYLPTPLIIFTWSLGLDLIPGVNRLLKPFHPNYEEFFSRDKKVGWVTGAFMFIRSEVVKKTKGFDENFFMYGEEVEWCKRMNDNGFNVYYTPNFEIVHLYAQSSKSTRNAFIKEVEGIYYFTQKHYPKFQTFVKLSVKTGMLMRAIAFKIKVNSYRSQIHFDAFKIK